MDRFKNYTIICLFAVIAVLLLLKQCGNGVKDNNGKYIKGSTISDTLTVHDTIRAVDTIVQTKWLKPLKPVLETPFESNDVAELEMSLAFLTSAS